MTTSVEQLPLLPTEKRCTKCGEVKPLEAFVKKRTEPDGHMSYCKACDASRAAEYRQSRTEKRCPACHNVQPVGNFPSEQPQRGHEGKRCANCQQARLVERSRARAEGTKTCRRCGKEKSVHEFYVHKAAALGRRPECIACIGDYARSARTADPERRRAIERTWRTAHGASRIAQKKAWRSANRDKWNTYSHRRRAWKRQAEGQFTDSDIADIYAAQGGMCAYCNQAMGDRYHIEHKQPLSKGGSNWPANLCLACPSCNWSKGTKTDAEFRNHLHQ